MAAPQLTLLPTSLAKQGGQLLPTSLAKGGAQLISPSVAGTLAGTQYNQAIADAQAALAQTQAGGKQALTNVNNWWQQILASQGNAAANGQAIDQSVANGETSSNAGILASLGGSANPAAEGVANAGQNNLGTLSAINAINAQYNQNLAPVLHMGAAGAEGQQQTKNANDLTEALQNIQDLQAQKGATQAQDAFQIMQQNNAIRDSQATRLLNIDTSNNQTRDNRVSTLASIVGANNSTTLNQLQLTDSEHQAAQSYALQLQGLHDTEKQNKVADILAISPLTAQGTLEPAAAKALAQLSGLDPKTFEGVNPKIAAASIAANNTAGVNADRSAQDWTKINHYQTGAGNQPVTSGGKLIPIAGYRDNAAGTGVVKIPTTSASASAHGLLTENEAGSVVDGWLTGKSQTTTERTGTDSNNNPHFSDIHTNGVGALNYDQMLAKAKAYGNPHTAALLTAQINASVAEGTHGRPFTTPKLALESATTAAQKAMAHGVPYATALKQIEASGLYPDKGIAVHALGLVYGAHYVGLHPNLATPDAAAPAPVVPFKPGINPTGDSSHHHMFR